MSGMVGHLARRPKLLQGGDGFDGGRLRSDERSLASATARRIRVVRRGLSIVAWTLPCMAVQSLCLILPGRPKIAFARLYWAIFTRLMGVRVRIVGEHPARVDGRPIVFVSNHTSWVDIPVVGGVLDGCFVAKGEVAGWPLIGTIARLGRTVFVSRQRVTTGKERDVMRQVLDRGDNLILFPEGTSSDGCRVLPFRSSFLAVAEARRDIDPSRVPMIQPVSVVYDRLGGLPIGRASRPVFAWYGDMDIGSHFWRLGQNLGLRATVVLHVPIDPLLYPDRKALTQAVWLTVADGAATLRQNRTPTPITSEPFAHPTSALPTGVPPTGAPAIAV
jgi:1-acyl-sn-glycerol-3-phosphate acyltransferase